MKYLILIFTSFIFLSNFSYAQVKLPDNQRVVGWRHDGFGVAIKKGGSFRIDKYMRKRGYNLKDWKIIEADLRMLFFDTEGMDQTISLVSGKEIIDTQTLEFTDEYEHNDPTRLTFTNRSDINNKKWAFKLIDGNRVSIMSMRLYIERI